MKFVLLGDDPAALPLIRALAAWPERALTHAALAGGLEAELLQIVPAVRLVGQWEELLTVPGLSAVIVGGTSDLIGLAAKQLAAAGQALVVFPQGGWDTELIYELSLHRDDNGVTLLPVLPWLEQPLIQQLTRELLAGGGRLLHLRCEREVQTPSGSERLGLSTDHVRRCLLPDVGLLRYFGGEPHQVTAVQSATPEGGIVQATITLAGEGVADAVWTIRPVSTPSQWRLTLTTDAGPFTLLAGDGQLNLTRPNQIEPPASEAALSQADDSATALREFIERGLAGEVQRPDWTDLTHDFEVLDAARRSLARRRTIDLHFETTSERSLFKTQMTALGCGLLLLTTLGVIGLLLVGAIFDTRSALETKANTAGTVFRQTDFAADSDKLSAAGEAHWDQLATQRRDPAIPMLIEQTADADLDRRRLRQLVTRLEQEGVPNPGQRVEVAALAGPWFEWVMKIARVLVFLPLFAFLGLQLLLFITRPAQSQRNATRNSQDSA